MRARRSPGSRGWVPPCRGSAWPAFSRPNCPTGPVSRGATSQGQVDAFILLSPESFVGPWAFLASLLTHTAIGADAMDFHRPKARLRVLSSRDLLHDIHPCRGCRCIDTLPIARFPRSFARAFAASRSRHAMPLRRWHRQAEVEIRAASEGPEPVAGSAAEQAVSAVAADPRPLEVPATRAGARPEARHPPARLSGAPGALPQEAAPGALPQEAAPGALPQEAASARPTPACPTPPTVATTCIRS
jgi:hypothetical protein